MILFHMFLLLNICMESCSFPTKIILDHKFHPRSYFNFSHLFVWIFVEEPSISLQNWFKNTKLCSPPTHNLPFPWEERATLIYWKPCRSGSSHHGDNFLWRKQVPPIAMGGSHDSSSYLYQTVCDEWIWWIKECAPVIWHCIPTTNAS